MRYAKRAAEDNKPVLGINAGRMGYLADIEQNELSLISKLFNGEYNIEKRIMLSVSVVENGKVLNEYNALNDAVITSGFISRIVDIQTFVGGDAISYRADGLIVATPTGSTAYSLSAGGPIVDPKLSCFCVTPICPHSLIARPLVFPDSAKLEIKNTCTREKILHLTVDGKATFDLFFGDTVLITKADISTKLLRIKDDDFYFKIRMKKFI